MKKINLQVKVSYTVNFDCEVTDEILEALECMQDEFPCGINDDDNITANKKVSRAFEWLNEQCKEGDAMSWSFEIEDLDEV